MSRNPDRCRRSGKPGFTLLEMLVVLAIISSLAMVVGPSVLKHLGTANATAVRSQLEMLSVALESYRIDNATYPSTEEGLGALHTRPEGSVTWRGPYVRRTIPLDPWGRAYIYRAAMNMPQDGYELYTLGRDGTYGGQGEDEDISAGSSIVQGDF